MPIAPIQLHFTHEREQLQLLFIWFKRVLLSPIRNIHDCCWVPCPESTNRTAAELTTAFPYSLRLSYLVWQALILCRSFASSISWISNILWRRPPSFESQVKRKRQKRGSSVLIGFSNILERTGSSKWKIESRLDKEIALNGYAPWMMVAWMSWISSGCLSSFNSCFIGVWVRDLCHLVAGPKENDRFICLFIAPRLRKNYLGLAFLSCFRQLIMNSHCMNSKAWT